MILKFWQEFSPLRNLRKVFYFCITSIIRGKHESRPEGARRPTAGDETREFTSRGEGGRVPPFFEKLRMKSKTNRQESGLIEFALKCRFRGVRSPVLYRSMYGDNASKYPSTCRAVRPPECGKIISDKCDYEPGYCHRISDTGNNHRPCL